MHAILAGLGPQAPDLSTHTEPESRSPVSDVRPDAVARGPRPVSISSKPPPATAVCPPTSCGPRGGAIRRSTTRSVCIWSRSAQRRVARNATSLGEVSDRLAASAPELPASFEGALIANELLDAMPVHQVVMREDGLREVYVDVARPLQGREHDTSSPARRWSPSKVRRRRRPSRPISIDSASRSNRAGAAKSTSRPSRGCGTRHGVCDAASSSSSTTDTRRGSCTPRRTRAERSRRTLAIAATAPNPPRRRPRGCSSRASGTSRRTWTSRVSGPPPKTKG